MSKFCKPLNKSILQAKTHLLIFNCRFNKDIGISGAILTKMDGDTRGGAALSVRGVSGKPIKFVGVGEGSMHLLSWSM